MRTCFVQLSGMQQRHAWGRSSELRQDMAACVAACGIVYGLQTLSRGHEGEVLEGGAAPGMMRSEAR